MTNPDPATNPDPRAHPERPDLGDIATAVVNGKRMIVQRTTAKQVDHAGGETVWATPEPVAGSRREVTSSWLVDARPLLVLDLADHTLTDRLADAFCAARWDHRPGSDECDPLTRDAMRAGVELVLRPPLAEPGLLGVVDASIDPGGLRFRWCQLEKGIWSSRPYTSKWAGLIDPVVVRPGIEDDS